MRMIHSSVNPEGDPLLYEFTQGIAFDALMFEEEISVQKAWAQALHLCGTLSEDELQTAERAFDEIAQLMKENRFPWNLEDEDIHLNIENWMTNRYGALGKKIHLGRSRNDLVATTLRLYVDRSLNRIEGLVVELMKAITGQASLHHHTLVPGMTHLQFAQPLRLSHILYGYLNSFRRDLAQLHACRRSCMETMPLGSAAFGGTHINVDLTQLAQTLGFESPPINSYDSVGDRDFLLQALSCYALISAHLARISQELIYWASTPIRIVTLPQRWATGSSIMPNKQNPDLLEILRARTARIGSICSEGHSIYRAIPMSYTSDLHELKKSYFTAQEELSLSLKVFSHFFKELSFSNERAQSLLQFGHILATDVANQMCEAEMPFREAYLKTAQWVADADALGKQVHHMMGEGDTQHLKETDQRVDDPKPFIDSVERRSQAGGTSLDNQSSQAEYWRLLLR